MGALSFSTFKSDWTLLAPRRFPGGTKTHLWKVGSSKRLLGWSYLLEQSTAPGSVPQDLICAGQYPGHPHRCHPTGEWSSSAAWRKGPGGERAGCIPYLCCPGPPPRRTLTNRGDSKQSHPGPLDTETKTTFGPAIKQAPIVRSSHARARPWSVCGLCSPREPSSLGPQLENSWGHSRCSLMVFNRTEYTERRLDKLHKQYTQYLFLK